MSSMIQGGLGTLKDMANPFFRLVNSATTDDGSHNVAYYQMEEIKEGAFQSDYGCDSIFKATLQRLETRSAVTVAKSLHIIRILMMEGPASFLPKVGMASGKFLQIASNSSPDIRRGSLEDKNRELAQAIHQAIAGDSKALARFSAENSHGPGMTAPSSSSSTHAGAAGNKPQSYKSEFLQQQEKEQRNHKKRLEEEQRNKTTLVVNERLLESFDGSLPPAKLVDSAIQNPKKKFTSEELSAFVDATLQTEKPQEVCNALDLILRDGKQSLQNRYKALTIVEAIVGSGQVPEGVLFFKSHSLGVQRHLTIERLDNPAKAEASKAVAQSILTLVLNSTPSTAASRQRSGSNVGPTASSSSASTAAAAPSSSAWTWNGPNQPPPPSNQKIASMDNLFSSLSVKNQPTHAAPKPTTAPPPQQQQQQQFVDPWGPSNSWGAAPPPAQAAAPPPAVAAAPLSHSNSFFHTAPSPALNASIVYPPTPNNSFSSFPSEGGGSSLNSTLLAQQVGALLMEQQQQQQQQPATPQAPPPPSSNDVAAQMEQFQRNMMLMMQMVQQQQQQQQQPPPQQQQSIPPPSVLPPPVAPLLPPPQPLQQEARSASVHSDRSENANHRLTTMDESSPLQPPQPTEVIAAVPSAAVSSPVAIRTESSPLPPPPPPPPPAAVVGPSAEAAATMALMQQLEKQMEATRNMLIQQQAAYVALQNQLQRQLMGQ